MASEHPVAPTPVSNGTGVTRNLFLDRDGSADQAEPTSSDREAAQAEIRRPPARRHGSQALVVPIREVASAADAGARLARVVPLPRPPRPGWVSRRRRITAALRGRASTCTHAVRERGADCSRSWGVAVARGLVLLLVVIVAAAALVQRDSARAARDDARRQLAAAEQSAAQLSHANRVLTSERDRALVVARESAREQSRAAAAARRWRRVAAQRRGHADRERRQRRGDRR